MNQFKGKIGTIYIRNVDVKTRNDFCAACAKQGKKMRTVLLELMKQYTKEKK